MRSQAKQHYGDGTIPATGFVRLPQILALVPIGKSSWWAGVREGRYPQPVRPSPFGRVTVWRAEEIHALLARAGGRQA
jgi:predicted DNA-binding transcriptional regulator AlpA